MKNALRVAFVVSLYFAAPVSGEEVVFPTERTQLQPVDGNPVFTAAPGQWDAKIRERGWILHDESGWRLWYTGYDGTREGQRKLGLATSSDGVLVSGR